MRKAFLLTASLLTAAAILLVILHWGWHSWLVAALVLTVVAVGCHDCFLSRDSIVRQFPLFGRLSRLMEQQRHIIQEVLLQKRWEGEPFNWIQKEIVFKRADDHLKSQPFGTQLSYSKTGREWLLHSAFPSQIKDEDFRVSVGGSRCRNPYLASILNIGGMSYGSVSRNATLALNAGAAIGHFAHNTGEGGLTSYHEQAGGDLIFQFGTGYFGCRDHNGEFDREKFRKVSRNETVRMIEIKISQGAKPGYGAILPAKKNTEEIAKIRNVPPHTEILSPPHHSAFSSPEELVRFIEDLRELSEGKPIGIKLCIGAETDFEDMVKTFVARDNGPDFITIDGGEGGTGAAHLDSLNWVGAPLNEGLHLAHQTLMRHGWRDRVKLLAGGRIVSSFDLFRALALGADACYSARGMMFALGCVQSLKCNLDTCPTGITTMNPSRGAALVVADKKQKVANYHRNTIKGLKDLLVAAGLHSLGDIRKDLVVRRVSETETRTYAQLFPDMT
jgi:glutamate synthase domain-containing protein 2